MRTSKLNRKKMQFVAIIAVTITSTPLIMIDENPIFNNGELVVSVTEKARPVNKAKVVLTYPNKDVANFETNKKGYAVSKKNNTPEIRLSAGAYQIEVSKSKYRSQKHRIYIPESGYVEKIIKLKQANNPPMANAGAAAFVQPNTKVYLDGSKSRDPDMPKNLLPEEMTDYDFQDEFGAPNGNRIETYQWRIVAKPESSQAGLENAFSSKASIIPDVEGDYDLTLSVSDGIDTHSDSIQVKCDFPYARKKHLPEPRGGHSSSIVKDKAYIIGGWHNVFKNSNFEYDFTRDTWMTKAPIETSRNHHLSFAYKSRIYVIGGHNKKYPNGISKVESYDPLFDTWSIKRPMPTPRYNLCAVLYQGKIYTFGGANGRKSFEVYDPIKDQWEIKPNMPVARFRHTCSEINGKIYLIGGKNTEDLNVEYDIQNGNWTLKKPMPTPRYYLSSSVLDGKIYVIGGHGRIRGVGIRNVEEYNPQKDEWKIMTSLPSPLDIHSMSVYSNKVYIFGGEKLFGKSSTMDTNQVYNPLFESKNL